MKGFSLVELLVVISIIAIISAFTLPNFMGARDKAKDSARIADMDSIKSALRLYYNDHQSYPIGNGVMLGAGMTGYMPSIMNLGYTYNYYQSNNGDSFCLSLLLDSGQGDEDIISQRKCGVKVGSTVCGVGNTTDKLFVVCAN